MNIEADLIALNEESVKLEQIGAQDTEHRAKEVEDFFEAHLSDQLIFRRANGSVVGKRGRGAEGFMEGLRKENPFESRVPEDVVVSPVGDRAMVSLIIVASKKSDKSVHRYRNIRLFSHVGGRWIMEFWYNYEIPDQHLL